MLDIKANEIDQMMDWIASFSDLQGKGTTRLLYSKSWQEALKALEHQLSNHGFQVEFDAVGNLIATIQGSEQADHYIATGSHIDTVTRGGRLDGQLGIMAGFLAISRLVEKYGQPKKSLRLIAMAEEEGSRFPYAFWGSKNIFGIAQKSDVVDIADKDGISFIDAMTSSGFNFLETEPQYKEMDAFIELHIEQGNFLEKEGMKVGIVNAIVGQKRFTVQLKGEANHAGTTLMAYRKDTVECFAKIVTSSLDRAKSLGDPLVLTFGRVEPRPNTVNVVPGETIFTIDTRHTDQQVLNQFSDFLVKNMRDIAMSMGIEINIDLWMDEAPVPMDKDLVSILEKVSEDLGNKSITMHSGAGHDSQIFAEFVPTAMIFVPSINGISHNPEEHTNAEDIVDGIETLGEALRRLAY